MAGTPFRPHDGPGRDSAVLAALARLWEAAEQAGASLSQARLSRGRRGAAGYLERLGDG